MYRRLISAFTRHKEEKHYTYFADDKPTANEGTKDL